MKLGVFSAPFGNKSFEVSLDIISSSGLQAIEIGTGGPGKCSLQASAKTN